MKAIELYKFIEKNKIEWHYGDNKGEEDVYILTFTYDVDEFYNINEWIFCFLDERHMRILRH